MSGEGDAFAQIVAIHHGDLLRVSFVICGDHDLAEQAAQAAWVRAWRSLRSLRDPDRLRPWLISIGANEARQLARTRRRHQGRETELSETLRSADDSEQRDDVLDLASALARLKPDDRAVLALRYVLGMNASEISGILNLSPSGVRSRLSRLVATLREELGNG